MSGPINNWSFSKLLSYEGCPMRVKLKYIDRIPEPERDPNNDPLLRGSNIHDNLERFIKGEGTLDGNQAKALDNFVPMLEHLQELYAIGKAHAEDDWLYDDEWQPCSKQGYWLWVKLDYFVKDEELKLLVVGDWKSGKSGYKTIEHIQQTQLYAATAALRYPWADEIVTEIPYVDEGKLMQHTYSRDQALSFISRFENRAQRMLNDTMFRPNPNKVTCKWCPYSPRGNGACPVGV